MNHRLNFVLEFFERVLPGLYRTTDIRKTQVEMAVSIAGILGQSMRNRILLAHAPVGTGKSFAALTPAIYDTHDHKKRLIYSTSSLNLQSQLRNVELTLLLRSGQIENFIIAKGITHYVCPKRFERARISENVRRDLTDFSVGSIEGDRVLFEKSYYPVSDDIWQQVNLQSQSDCIYCRQRAGCPTNGHRHQYNNPLHNVVVTNHNQLVQSVLNRQAGVMPILDFNNPGGTIVIDEAHDFEDAVLSQLSESIKLDNLIRGLRQASIDLRERGTMAFLVIRDYMKTVRRQLESGRGRHPIPTFCFEALGILKKVFDAALEEETARRLDNPYYMQIERDTLLEQNAGILDKLLRVREYASWFNIEDQSIEIVTRRFKSATAQIIRDLAASNKLVFMSGTLAVDQKFDHLYYAWGGKPARCEEVILDTVFEYPKQAIVYVPQDISRPVSAISKDFRAYCEELGAEILKLIQLTGGRTLILTTSHKQLEYLYEYLASDLDALGIAFFKQGEKSVELLTEDFKTDETSCLIATGSFFAGLSAPGKSLISVILCRLPFPHPDDPFLHLVAEGLTPYEKLHEVDFPRMIIRMLQAGGRLIRTIEDFGCFTILDPRVYDSDYAEKVLEELDGVGYKLTRDLGEVEQFISGRMNTSGFAHYPEYRREDILIPESLLADDTPRGVRNTESVILTGDIERVLTHDQRLFYEKVRGAAGMNTALIKSINDPYAMLFQLTDLAIRKGLNIDVPEEFPYATKEQERIMRRRLKRERRMEVSPLKTYRLSDEELEKYRNP